MDPELKRTLPALSADELTEALRRHFDSSGGMAPESELVLARELVRRARRAEACGDAAGQ